MNTTLANIIRNLLLEAGLVHFIQWDKDEQVVTRIRVFHRDEEGGAVETVLTRDSLLSDLGALLK